jgi:hypothetical protein
MREFGAVNEVCSILQLLTAQGVSDPSCSQLTDCPYLIESRNGRAGPLCRCRVTDPRKCPRRLGSITRDQSPSASKMRAHVCGDQAIRPASVEYDAAEAGHLRTASHGSLTRFARRVP